MQRRRVASPNTTRSNCGDWRFRQPEVHQFGAALGGMMLGFSSQCSTPLQCAFSKPRISLFLPLAPLPSDNGPLPRRSASRSRWMGLLLDGNRGSLALLRQSSFANLLITLYFPLILMCCWPIIEKRFDLQILQNAHAPQAQRLASTSALLRRRAL